VVDLLTRTAVVAPNCYFLLTHLALLSYQKIVAFRPDIVITEKGVSDLAQHYFLKAGITAFRRLRKTDQNRVARATGEEELLIVHVALCGVLCARKCTFGSCIVGYCGDAAAP
jgi:hypothetical protein